MAAFVLAQFARQADDRQAPVGETRGQPADGGAGIGKDDGRGRVVKAQQVDDGMFSIGRGHLHHLIGDVGVLGSARQRGHADRIALVLLGQFRDRRRDRGRKEQRPAIRRCRAQHELQILAEAEIQHLVRLVQHDGADVRQIERATRDVVAQPAGGADDDMGAAFERAPFLARVHPADARHHARTRFGIKPGQFALHLKGQFARRRHDQCKGGGRRA